MYFLHPVSLPTNQVELSRRAAEHYAVLASIKEWRAQQRGAPRRSRAVQVMPERLSIEASTESVRC